jgi:hypothetical protein
VPQAHCGALFACAYHALWGALLRLGYGTVAASDDLQTPFLVLPYQDSGLKLHYCCQDKLKSVRGACSGSPLTSRRARERAGVRAQGRNLSERGDQYTRALLEQLHRQAQRNLTMQQALAASGLPSPLSPEGEKTREGFVSLVQEKGLDHLAVVSWESSEPSCRRRLRSHLGCRRPRQALHGASNMARWPSCQAWSHV